MVIKFLTHIASQCGVFNPGDEAEINDSLASEYISLGYAELVGNPELAILPPVQHAMKSIPKRSK